MNHAEEWSARMRALKADAPRFTAPATHSPDAKIVTVAAVSDDGDLHLAGPGYLDAPHAVEFGKWLLETFSDFAAEGDRP